MVIPFEKLRISFNVVEGGENFYLVASYFKLTLHVYFSFCVVNQVQIPNKTNLMMIVTNSVTPLNKK